MDEAGEEAPDEGAEESRSSTHAGEAERRAAAFAGAGTATGSDGSGGS